MEINYLAVPETVSYVDLSNGLQVPERLKAEVTDIGIPAVIEIEVAVRDGVVVCDRIALRSVEGGPPITREMLRDVPIASLATALMANRSLISDFSHSAWGDIDKTRVFAVHGDSAPDEVQDWVRTQTAPRRRHRITDEFLREVAAVYRRNIDGGAPTQAVAKEKSVSHSTAARYVAQARQRGLLGQTKAGSAGEREEQP